MPSGCLVRNMLPSLGTGTDLPNDAIIWTEGKTDGQHLTSAARALKVPYNLSFDPVSGRHLFDPHLSVGHKGKLPPPSSSAIRVIDSEVYDANHNNVAMSKAEFARNIFDATEPFSRFDFTQFSKVFSIIGNIIDSCN